MPEQTDSKINVKAGIYSEEKRLKIIMLRMFREMNEAFFPF